METNVAVTENRQHPAAPARSSPVGDEGSVGAEPRIRVIRGAYGMYEAWIGRKVVGKAYPWTDSRDKFVMMNVRVSPNFRRQGVATALYSEIERQTGKTLEPAISLSDEGFEFWKSYRPSAVAHDLRHRVDELVGRAVMTRHGLGLIETVSGRTVNVVLATPTENGATKTVLLDRDLEAALAAAAETFEGAQTTARTLETPPDDHVDLLAKQRPSRAQPVTQTPFERWFGQSVIRDASGAPRMLFHGTRAAFDEFDPRTIGSTATALGHGFYFTTHEQTASGYTGPEGGRIIRAFVAMQKPLPVDTPRFGQAELRKILDRAIDLEIEQEALSGYQDSFLSNFVDTSRMARPIAVTIAARMLHQGNKTAVDQICELSNVIGNKILAPAAVRDVLGFDGISAPGSNGDDALPETIYIAWFPEQIKSAEANVGTFDPNDRRIYHREMTRGAPLGYEGVMQELNDAYGADNIARLLVEDLEGLSFHVVHSEELPENKKPLAKQHPRMQAFFDGRCNVYLLHDRLSAGEARMALIHEIGVHFGARRIMGEEAFGRMIKDVRALVARDNAASKLAYSYVQRTYDLDEEGEKFWEEVAARLVETAPQISVHKTWLTAFKTGLYRLTGLRVVFDEHVLRKIATDSLRACINHDLRKKSALSDVVPSLATLSAKLLNTATSFEQWFGKSRIMDASGRPLVLYHGTDRDFAKFKSSTRGLFGEGIYLSTDRVDASQYQTQGEPKAVYASLQRPFYTVADYEAGEAVDLDAPSVPFLRKIFGDQADPFIDRMRTGDGLLGSEVREALEKMGHDGIVVTWPNGLQHVVAFKPEQIRPADSMTMGISPGPREGRPETGSAEVAEHSPVNEEDAHRPAG